jgi:hypothetical protein
MALFNLCGCCGHRVSETLKQCRLCGSTSDTKRGKKILSSVFLVAAVLLIIFITRIL